MIDLPLRAVVGNAPGSSELPGDCLNLGPHRGGYYLIQLPQADPDVPTRMREYVKQPFWKSGDDLDRLSGCYKISVITVALTVGNLPDEVLLAQAKTASERARLQEEFRRRDARYAIILPILRRSAEDPTIRSAVEMITDSELPAKMRKIARRGGPTLGTIYKLLSLYFAGGCVKNALRTRYFRCGCPGKRRTQNSSRGRKARLHEEGLPRCYVLDKGMPPDKWKFGDTDRSRLGFGWRLIKHGLTKEAAYLAVSGMFYAEHVQEKTGQVRAILWAPHLRPTIRQFDYWGPIMNENVSATQMILGPRKYAQMTETRGGSEQDSVVMVGQLGAFDGTSCDVYLTSVRSRLKVLPPQLRLVIKDVLTGVWCGWYLGWGPTSPQKAQQAIFHAASSKREEAERLNVRENVDAIPEVLHRTYEADNGELKAESITEFEEQTGVGIIYRQARRGDKKPGSESGHHKMHKALDHQLPGSTKGKQRERGEDHPGLEALYNDFEYRRELFMAAIETNLEVVPDLAPVDMDPAIPKTRINIFNWLRRHQTAEVPRNLELLRALALPDVEVVIRKNGVYPFIEVLGTKVVIPLLRFSSPELVATGLLSAVKQSGRVIHTRMKIDQDPHQAWLPTKAGLIPLRIASRRESTRDKMCWQDWVAEREDRLRASDAGRADQQQQALDKLFRRKDTEENARRERDAEIQELGKEPSKASRVRGIKANLVDEKKTLEQGESSAAAGPSRRSLRTSSGLVEAPLVAREPLDPASAAMRKLNEEEFGT